MHERVGFNPLKAFRKPLAEMGLVSPKSNVVEENSFDSWFMAAHCQHIMAMQHGGELIVTPALKLGYTAQKGIT